MTDAERRPDRGTIAVLVVEDDTDLARLLARRLNRHGLEVRIVVSGEEAIVALAQQQVSIAFVDIGLPGIDGWTLIEGLRRASQTASLPVVVVTARDEAPGRRRSVDGWLSKPFDQRAVDTIVHQLLESGDDGTVSVVPKGR